MTDGKVSVRYMVNDVDAAIDFYTSTSGLNRVTTPRRPLPR